MTIKVYRVGIGGVRHTVRPLVEITADGPVPFMTSLCFPPCACPRCAPGASPSPAADFIATSNDDRKGASE